MNLEEMKQLEVAERIAFERGRQQSLTMPSEDPAYWAHGAVEDLGEEMSEVRQRPIVAAYIRGVEAGKVELDSEET